MQTSFRPLRTNSFTFLRMALAIAVIFGHSFPLGGFGSDAISRWCGSSLAIHEIALQCFFILSGYLLMGSLTVNPSLARFALRRCFRILPGYWFALLVTALVVAPAIFARLFPDVFKYRVSLFSGEWSAVGYILRNALLWGGQDVIPPLFFLNPVKAIVNGSLWTIFYEALCYAALGLASAIGILRRRNLVIALFGVIYLPCVIHSVFPIPATSPTSEWSRVLLITFHPAGPNLALPFAAGVVAHFLVRAKPVWNPRLFCIALAAFIVAIPLGAGRVFSPIVLPFLLLSLGEKLPFQKWERIGDFSFGIYIYGFLIQQCLVIVGVNRFGAVTYLLASIAGSLVAGAVSWFLIERPFIRIGEMWLARIEARKREPKGTIEIEVPASAVSPTV